MIQLLCLLMHLLMAWRGGGLGAVRWKQSSSGICIKSSLNHRRAIHLVRKESLAVTCACNHFNNYFTGALHFIYNTDHKPYSVFWGKFRITRCPTSTHPTLQNGTHEVYVYNYSCLRQGFFDSRHVAMSSSFPTKHST